MVALKDIARSAVKAMPPLYRQYNRIRGWRIHDADADVPYLSLGGDGGVHNYGAWVVPVGLLSQASVVYSFGIGDDVSFDLEVIERFGCHVYAYDPTPGAASYIEHLAPDPRFLFHQIGIAAEDGTATFYVPEEVDRCLSMPREEKGGDTSNHSQFPVNRVSTLMSINGHRNIDLLKMDIEGFEYTVIDDMLDNGILPKCIVLEFHHFQREDPGSTRRAVSQLKKAGYQLFWVSELGAEYGFCLPASETK